MTTRTTMTKIPDSIKTLSRSSYLWRGVLYFSIAFLGVLQLGVGTGKPILPLLIAATVAGLTAVRAYIDRSPAQVERGTSTDDTTGGSAENAASAEPPTDPAPTQPDAP